MSVRDRINSMNSLITEETLAAKEAKEAEDSIKRMKSRHSDLSLKFSRGDSETSFKSQGSGRSGSLRSISSESSLKSPLQLPGMVTEKGGV